VEAHHIRQWAKHPEMAFNPANGITLCTACHTSINGREKEFEKFFDFLVERSAKPQSTPRKASRTLAFSHTGPMEPVKLLSFNARPHQIEHFRLANSLPA
jgi:cytochrome c peroxidase